MIAVQINLPDDLKSLAEQRVASGEYADLSDYVSRLIREDQARAEQGRLESLLRQRMDAGPSTPMTEADFGAIRKRLDDRAAARQPR